MPIAAGKTRAETRRWAGTTPNGAGCYWPKANRPLLVAPSQRIALKVLLNHHLITPLYCCLLFAAVRSRRRPRLSFTSARAPLRCIVIYLRSFSS